MSQTPNPTGRPDDGEPDFMEMLQQMMGSQSNPAMDEALKNMGVDRMDPAAMNMLAGQLRSFFSQSAPDGIDMDMCKDVARKTVAASGSGDAVVPDSVRGAVEGAVRVASLWVDTATVFDSQPTAVHAWSRAEWVEATIDTWSSVIAPLADGVTGAITEAMQGQMEQLKDTDPSEIPGMPALPAGMDMGALLDQMRPMMQRVSGSIFSMQFGQAIGTLAGETVSGTEVGLPLVNEGTVALLPANVGSFGNGLEIDANEVLLYLAVREVARVRLFADVTWLGPQLLGAVEQYARDITLDTDGIRGAVESLDPTSMDPSDMEAMQQALVGQMFSPEPSAAQQAALTRLETLLALVEGWVDTVADQATREHLPHSAALAEAVRRRRATGGPAEDLFERLVGLQMRPRRMRDAANLFAALESSGDQALRDSAWRDPESAPTAEDLDDVLGYVERITSGGKDDMDRALEDILAGGTGTGFPGSDAAGETPASNDGDDADQGEDQGEGDPPRND